jgi:hypothetical protein
LVQDPADLKEMPMPVTVTRELCPECEPGVKVISERGKPSTRKHDAGSTCPAVARDDRT